MGFIRVIDVWVRESNSERLMNLDPNYEISRQLQLAVRSVCHEIAKHIDIGSRRICNLPYLFFFFENTY